MFDLSLSESKHLHGFGVESSGEVTGGVAVRNQCDVLPEQLLDEVVHVDQQRCDSGFAFGNVTGGGKRSDEYGVTHTGVRNGSVTTDR